MSQFQENLRINGRTGGRTGGRTDRPCFIGPFQPRLGSNKFVIIDEPWMTGKISIHKLYMMSNGNTVIDYQKLRDIGNKIS